MTYDVVIIGAGVIGSMLSRELSKYQLSVCVLEKENDVALGASKANSGIVHGGFDPEPGTLKARLNVSGVAMLYEAAEQLHVPFVQNGSLVCAFSAREEQSVRELYERGLANGVQGLRLLDGDSARALEPHLSESCTLALDVPSAGIICPYELTVAAMGNAMDNGADLLCSFEVSKVTRDSEGFTLTSTLGKSVRARFVVNCAGAYSDRISELFGQKEFSIVPRAGEYLLLDKEEGARVKRTIFQVPTAQGKGILVSPTADGNLLTGPTANAVSSPEDKDVTPGGIETVICFAKKSVPSIQFRQVITSFTGIRASEKDGDFIIRPSHVDDRLIHVAAIDSPGLSCCVSIARYTLDVLKRSGLELSAKPRWNPYREDPHAFRRMTDEQKHAYIQNNPSYGKIVCRCEIVSEGEILNALRQNPPANDIDGVKRRTRSGMGRCQGGFCSPYVMDLIAKERGIPREQGTKKGKGSEFVVAKI